MGEIAYRPQYQCPECNDTGWVLVPGGHLGLRRCSACRRSEESETPENRVVEVDGGALTPAECEAKMRADRDRAMRVGLGFEAADSGKTPADPTTSTTADTDRIIQADIAKKMRQYYGTYYPGSGIKGGSP